MFTSRSVRSQTSILHNFQFLRAHNPPVMNHMETRWLGEPVFLFFYVVCRFLNPFGARLSVFKCSPRYIVWILLRSQKKQHNKSLRNFHALNWTTSGRLVEFKASKTKSWIQKVTKESFPFQLSIFCAGSFLGGNLIRIRKESEFPSVLLSRLVRWQQNKMETFPKISLSIIFPPHYAINLIFLCGRSDV